MADQFDQAIEASRQNLLALVEAGESLRESHQHVPSVGSPAMSELAAQEKFTGDWGQEPVDSAHSWAGVLLACCEDQLRSICRLVVGDVSVFGPQTIARSAIELAGRSGWFSEAGIGITKRVVRFQTERLFNASELTRLMGPTEHTTALAKRITTTAKSFGLELISGKNDAHTHIVERRPKGNAIFKRALGDQADLELGHTMFSLLSGVDHGTLYALLQATDGKVLNGPVGQTLAPLGVTTTQTRQLLLVGGLAYGAAANSFAILKGWADDDWGKTYMNAMQQAFALL